MSKLRKQPFERTRERSFPISRSRQLVQYTLTKSSGVRTKTYDRTTTMSWPNLEFMKDIVTPGFEQLKANGKYVLNAMSSGSTLYQESSSGATLRYEDSASVIDWTESGSCIATYFGAPAQLGFVPNIDNLVRLTQTQCLSNVKTSDMMGFVAIAEARKTLAMLLNPLGSLKSLAKHLYDQHVAKKNLRIDWVNGELRRVNGRVFRVRFTKHRGPGRVVSPAKRSVVVPFGETLSGSVLAWNLGFKPLLQDINAILKQIPQAHQVAAQTYRAKSVDGYTTTSTESKKVSVLNATFARKDTQKVTVRCNVVAEDNWSILSDFGLAPADIPEAVWEVIPFSFLVDYVVNIGEYLAALKATAYQKIYAWSTTVELENLTERTLSSYTVDPPWAMVVPSTGYDSLLVKSKYRNHGSFGASLAYRPLQVALSPVHIQNILSLTVQSLSGISRGGRAPFK